jgi:hypothetical protein
MVRYRRNPCIRGYLAENTGFASGRAVAEPGTVCGKRLSYLGLTVDWLRTRREYTSCAQGLTY